MRPIPRAQWEAASEKYKSAIAEGVQKLLSEKHLYQNVKIDVPPLDKLDGVLKGMVLEAWHLAAPAETVSVQPNMLIRLPSIRTYCKSCKERLPFNPITAQDVTWHDTSVNLLSQLFVLSYCCQGCHQRVPETFLIKRVGNEKLMLCGRFPMEAIEISKVLPKQQSKVFSDAIIAFNSGQTLAGLFLLRTFTEQFVTAETGKRLDEGGWDDYATAIPIKLRQIIPSLSDQYTKLSEALHEAKADDELFNEVRESIVVHFEGLDLAKKAAKLMPSGAEA